VVVDKSTRRILATSFCEGKKHDFRLFKESRFRCAKTVKLVCDSRYLGIAKRHPNCVLPFQASKKKPLTQTDKAHNRALAKERIVNEHVIRYLKRFRILQERYRNRRRRFSLRFNLIAAIYNLQHTNI
jgi:DDE superfamily endonuclease